MEDGATCCITSCCEVDQISYPNFNNYETQLVPRSRIFPGKSQHNNGCFRSLSEQVAQGALFFVAPKLVGRRARRMDCLVVAFGHRYNARTHDIIRQHKNHSFILS